jgi:uncharacterized paraquat-inducible protein A
MQKLRVGLGFFILISAYILLIPGITEPVLHVKTTLDKAELAILGKEAILSSDAIPNFLMPMAMEVLNQVQVTGTVVINDSAKSILGTSEELWNDGNHLVAFLIIFFSVFVPAIKLLLLSVAVAFRESQLESRLAKASAAMSKWSMADVFVMALIISFLAIKASSGHSSMVTNEITLEIGFYYFLGYCLLSILAGQFLISSKSRKNN